MIAGLGHVDILVNAPEGRSADRTLDVDEADWNAILDTNLTGTLRACQVFGRHMLERGYGRIINIASFSVLRRALRGRRLLGQQGRRRVPHEVAGPRMGPPRRERQRHRPRRLPHRAQPEPPRRHGARPQFLTRTPLKRFGRVEELAGAAVFLASEAASFVNGEVLVVDGGFLASGVNQ